MKGIHFSADSDWINSPPTHSPRKIYFTYVRTPVRFEKKSRSYNGRTYSRGVFTFGDNGNIKDSLKKRRKKLLIAKYVDMIG